MSQINKTTCESIKVCVRVRPKLENENERQECVTCTSTSVIVQNRLKCRYDYIFSQTSTQDDLVSKCMPMIEDFLQGYNCTIFAYGQTGSGKTHSMFGKGLEEMFLKGQSFNNLLHNNWGIIPRSVEYLFQSMANLRLHESNSTFSLYCSFLQIYNDEIFDLLQDKNMKYPLKLNEYPKPGQKGINVVIRGLSEVRVYSLEDVMSLLYKGIANRSTSSTEYNATSSRSHAILQLRLESEEITEDNIIIRKTSKCNLVDLAGSEKWNTNYKFDAKRTNELININTSLLALGNCIAALGSNNSHIPYRDSKLTRLLQDSLGGNTKTLLLVTISPLVEYEDETVSSLTFGDRAKKVMIKAQINTVSDSSNQFSDLNHQLLQLHKDYAQLELENLDLKRKLRDHTNHKDGYNENEFNDNDQEDIINLRKELTILSDNFKDIKSTMEYYKDTIEVQKAKIRSLENELLQYKMSTNRSTDSERNNNSNTPFIEIENKPRDVTYDINQDPLQQMQSSDDSLTFTFLNSPIHESENKTINNNIPPLDLPYQSKCSHDDQPETYINPRDIQVLTMQSGCSVELAQEMLIQFDGDVVTALEEILDIKKTMEEEENNKNHQNNEQEENDKEFNEYDNENELEEQQHQHEEKQQDEYYDEENDNDNEEEAGIYIEPPRFIYSQDERRSYSNHSDEGNIDDEQMQIKVKPSTDPVISRKHRSKSTKHGYADEDEDYYRQEIEDFNLYMQSNKYKNEVEKLPPLKNKKKDKRTENLRKLNRTDSNMSVIQRAPIPLEKLKKDPYAYYERPILQTNRTIFTSRKDDKKNEKERKKELTKLQQKKKKLTEEEKEYNQPRNPHLEAVYGYYPPMKSQAHVEQKGKASNKAKAKRLLKQSQSELLLTNKRSLLRDYKNLMVLTTTPPEEFV